MNEPHTYGGHVFTSTLHLGSSVGGPTHSRATCTGGSVRAPASPHGAGGPALNKLVRPWSDPSVWPGFHRRGCLALAIKEMVYLKLRHGRPCQL